MMLKISVSNYMIGIFEPHFETFRSDVGEFFLPFLKKISERVEGLKNTKIRKY